ncbi:hypothetical protein [Actinomadura sp. NEAU-AAG7]|uniref:hypothetical protein n=1 Tax=Actinomadura sp. NEAU-AAG7 TaxID=2839640 RepID=UPI001BE4741F|nr:hypothetical protein [Actinomadura sp. NEAU-AAG7]MBT2209878.1 hypothetical protein [Actinomadura sp. NEAU-AAG7]
MDSDDPGRREGGPRRAPVSRSGRGRAAPRRTSGRSAAPRGAGQGRPGRRPRPAPRPEVPRPEVPYQDPAGYEAPYDDASYQDQAYQDQAYQEPVYAAAPRETRRPAKGRKRPSGRGGSRTPRRPAASGGDPGSARRPRAALGSRAYFGAAGALGAVVIVGLGAVVLLRGGDDPVPTHAPAAVIGRPAGSGPSPTSYSSSPTSAAYAGIAARTSDAGPLTAGEAFPPSAATIPVPDSDVKLTLRTKRLDGDCAAAVWGATVAADLRRGGCTQAARGLYASTGRGERAYGMAVAVFNLAGSADADRFVGLLDRTRGGGFVRPPAATGPLGAFGQGFGMARGLAMGHFAVVSWAQRLDGGGDERDETLLSLLIEGGKAPAVLGRAARAPR